MKEGREVDIATGGACSCFEEVTAGVSMAPSGWGLNRIYRFFVEKEIKRGELVEILEGNAGCSRPFSILYPHRSHLPLRVRMFIDFLLERIKQ